MGDGDYALRGGRVREDLGCMHAWYFIIRLRIPSMKARVWAFIGVVEILDRYYGKPREGLIEKQWREGG